MAGYMVHKVALACVYMTFATLTAINIVSSRADSEAGLLDGIVGVIFPASLAIPIPMLIVGVASSVFRRSAKPLIAWAIVSAASIPMLLVFDNYALECDVSREVRRRIHLELSVRERASLRTPESTCPTFFSYKRDSDSQWAVVTGAADFWHGPQVSFTTQ